MLDVTPKSPLRRVVRFTGGSDGWIGWMSVFCWLLVDLGARKCTGKSAEVKVHRPKQETPNPSLLTR